MPSHHPLKDHVVAITGGNQGLGRAYALSLAQAGAKLILFGRSQAHLDQTLDAIHLAGGSAAGFSLDVTDASAVTQRFTQAAQVYGEVDVLINNAGNIGPLGYAWQVDPAHWWQVMDVHLRGSYLCAQQVLPQMTARRHGRIINIVSHAGAFRWPTLSAYSVAKAALIKFTENLAVECRPFAVKAFAFHPGIVIGAGLVSNLEEQPQDNNEYAQLMAWIEHEKNRGNSVTPQVSAQRIVEIASGAVDSLTGRYLTAHDDVLALARRGERIARNDALTLRIKPVGAVETNGMCERYSGLDESFDLE